MGVGDAWSGIDLTIVLNKLIFANLTHRPVRTLLSVLAIAVEVTMILTLVGVSHGTLDSTKERARGWARTSWCGRRTRR